MIRCINVAPETYNSQFKSKKPSEESMEGVAADATSQTSSLRHMTSKIVTA